MYLRSLFYKNTSNFCDLNWNLKYFLKNKISIFKGIISIIPVLLIALVVIIVTLARLLKCWKNSNRSNRSGNRSQQAVFTTDQFNAYDSTNGSILDYNQALSCSVKIEKDPNESKFKEEMLPTYNDALKMKTSE